MATLLHDLRFGMRMLARNPGFTLAAILVLALGIGANTAMFSLVNAFLLKPLVIQKPEELRGVYSRDTTKPDVYRAFSYPNYADLRSGNSVFSSLAAHDVALIGLTQGDATRRVFADIVSSNYFATFGVPLFRGRTFTAEEERPGAQIPVAIISYSHWQRSGADPNITGKPLELNGRTFTIVGIAPRGFTGSTAMASPELYVPLGVFEWVVNDFEGHVQSLAARDYHTLILIGRLRPGVTQNDADRQLEPVAAQLAQAYPAVNRNQAFLVRPLARMSITTSPANDNVLSAAGALLLAMAGVVLLIASLNVANMMLARGASRRKEIAVRLALGASRGNILHQLFTEGFLLALVGGAAGLSLAYWSMPAVMSTLSSRAPIELVYNGAPDIRVLAATMGFCLLSTLLFGFGPAWHLSKQDVVSAIKGSDGTPASGMFGRLFSRRNLLVMSQLALSLALLTAAGLFLHSAVRMAQMKTGFRVDDELVAEVDASLAGYNEARARQLYSTVVDRLNAVPGVESASLAATVPFGSFRFSREVEKAGGAPSASSTNDGINCSFNMVGADYFRTLSIPLLRGRAFQPADAREAGAPVVILDKLAADRLWPGGGAVGQMVRIAPPGGTGNKREAQVVGIVENVRESVLGGTAEPHLYVPFGQEFQANVNFHMRLRTEGPAGEARLLDTIRQTIRSADPRLPLLGLRSLRNHMENSMDLWIVRSGSNVFSLFGAFALLVASVGLYGVRAYAVARRTREIGIRMAVGASAHDTVRMILREGLAVTAVGAGVGLLLSLAIGRVLSGVLFEVTAMDPLVLCAAPALLAAVSLVACYFPARRAARIQPMTALRQE